MLSSGASERELREDEIGQLDSLANATADAPVSDESVQEEIEAGDQLEPEILTRLALRFLAGVDRPLWDFDPGRLSVGSEPTFSELIRARENALAKKRAGTEE